MNILVAFLGYKSETCLPKSKYLKSMPISIFLGGMLVNVWGVRTPPENPPLDFHIFMTVKDNTILHPTRSHKINACITYKSCTRLSSLALILRSTWMTCPIFITPVHSPEE